MNSQNEFAYIPRGYLCLILKTAVNNAWTDTDDWSLSIAGHLLLECNIINIFKYESIKYIDFDFIKTDYQWLYVYHLFVYGYLVTLELPEKIDGSALQIFDEKRVAEFPTDTLKACSKLFLEEFVKIATFPNLKQEWLNLFKYLQENKLFWGELSHPTAKQIIYNADEHRLLDELGNEINWYDILSLHISPKTPINQFNLNAHKHDLYYSITSVNNTNWDCTYSPSSYNTKNINQPL